MNRIVLHAVAAAIVCAAAPASRAQNAPTLYGLLDGSVGRFEEPGARHRYAVQSGSMSLSFIGIRGSDDLGGGLRARYGLEAYVAGDTGNSGRFAGDPFFSRSAYVGLQGAFGATLLGRVATPLWNSVQQFNPFGDSVAFSPSLRQYFGGAVLGDSRWNNSIAFSSPEPEDGTGLRYGVQFNASEGGVRATGKNVGAHLLYTSGPLAATFVWQRVRNSALPLPVGFNHQSTYYAGASYEFPFFRLYGQFGHVRTSAAQHDKTTLYQFGAAVPVGLGFIMAAYGRARLESPFSDSTRGTFSLGYDYFLSKHTDLYAAWMNERVTNLSTANTIAAGVRLRF